MTTQEQAEALATAAEDELEITSSMRSAPVILESCCLPELLAVAKAAEHYNGAELGLCLTTLRAKLKERGVEL